jgi:tRNA threonylcarbamoyladenosine biosynthesis protein TsaE
VRLDEIELVQWGERIGQRVGTPTVIALSGPLGAGKSVLARAIGRGAGVEVPMPSPSYNLLLRYPTARKLDVVHLDLFRIESQEELWELGWSQLGAPNEIVLVEWPERAEGVLPSDHWEIELSITDGDPLRRDIEVRRLGAPTDLPGFPMSVSVSGG